MKLHFMKIFEETCKEVVFIARKSNPVLSKDKARSKVLLNDYLSIISSRFALVHSRSKLNLASAQYKLSQTTSC